MSEGVGSSRTAAAASQTGPDDLAAELNPHKQSRRLAAPEQIKSGAFPRTGRSPRARRPARAEPATTSPAIRSAHGAQLTVSRAQPVGG